VQDPAMVPMQIRALTQHATQVSVHDGYYALSNRVPSRLSGREGFARFDPVAGRLLPGKPGAERVQGLLHHQGGRQLPTTPQRPQRPQRQGNR